MGSPICKVRRCSNAQYIPQRYTRSFCDMMRESCMLPNVVPPMYATSGRALIRHEQEMREHKAQQTTVHIESPEDYL